MKIMNNRNTGGDPAAHNTKGRYTMRLLYKEAIRINRRIKRTNDVTHLCWIINDIGLYKGMIDLDEDEKLFNLLSGLSFKTIEKVRKLSEQNNNDAR